MRQNEKSEYRLIPWIFRHFNKFIIKPESSAFAWSFDSADLLYKVKDSHGNLLAKVDIHLNKYNVAPDGLLNTEFFTLGFDCTDKLLDSVKLEVWNELLLIIERLKKLENRIDDIFDKFFPRSSDGHIDWDKCPFAEKASAFKRTEDVRIDLIGNPCGLNCIFCSVPLNTEHNSDATSRLLQHEQLYAGLFDIGSAGRKNLRLQFLSTDPIGFPDIVSLVNLGKRNGYSYISIATAMMHELSSGTLLEDLARAGLNMLDIPIYGISAETNDSVTGRAGHFECLKTVARRSSKLGIKIKYHSVTLKTNMHELEGIPALAHELGGYFYNFMYVRYHGDCRLPVNGLMPRLSDLSLNVRRHMNLKIPCLEVGTFSEPVKIYSNGREEEIRVENSGGFDSTFEFEHAEKCESCAERSVCSGIYPPYLEIYGDEEFKPF